MSTNSKIEWTNVTWNPVVGCTRVSAGCDNCYAVRVSHRLESMDQKAYAGLTRVNGKGQRHFNGTVRTLPERLNEPLTWRKPRMIFVNSMSDLFHESVPFEFIGDVYFTMSRCQQHTFQVLTKRPERRREFFAWYKTAGLPTGLWDNVWEGISAEDQQTLDKRLPHLLATRAAVRFLSLEPLLGPIDLTRCDHRAGEFIDVLHGQRTNHGDATYEDCPTIDWVIVGGESGPKARPMNPEWARSIRDQCVAASVPFFFKQWGEWAPTDSDDSRFDGKDCVQVAEEDGEVGPLNVRYGPVVRSKDGSTKNASPMSRMGKKAAGRLLDGRTWDEMPQRAGKKQQTENGAALIYTPFYASFMGFDEIDAE